MEAYIWHVAAGNIDKALLSKIIYSVINREELDEGTKLEVIHAMQRSPLFSEEERTE
jgi:death-on-curing protein